MGRTLRYPTVLWDCWLGDRKRMRPVEILLLQSLGQLDKIESLSLWYTDVAAVVARQRSVSDAGDGLPSVGLVWNTPPSTLRLRRRCRRYLATADGQASRDRNRKCDVTQRPRSSHRRRLSPVQRRLHRSRAPAEIIAHSWPWSICNA